MCGCMGSDVYTALNALCGLIFSAMAAGNMQETQSGKNYSMKRIHIKVRVVFVNFATLKFLITTLIARSHKVGCLKNPPRSLHLQQLIDTCNNSDESQSISLPQSTTMKNHFPESVSQVQKQFEEMFATCDQRLPQLNALSKQEEISTLKSGIALLTRLAECWHQDQQELNVKADPFFQTDLRREYWSFKRKCWTQRTWAPLLFCGPNPRREQWQWRKWDQRDRRKWCRQLNELPPTYRPWNVRHPQGKKLV